MGTYGRQEAPHEDCVYNRPQLRRPGDPVSDDKSRDGCSPVQLFHGPMRSTARMENLRWAAKRAGKRIGIMLDTKGPEIRLGRFRNGKAHLEEGSRFALTSEEILGNTEQASVSFPRLAEVVSPGALILLDDGNVQLEVLEAGDGLIITRVLNSGWISDRKKVPFQGRG